MSIVPCTPASPSNSDNNGCRGRPVAPARSSCRVVVLESTTSPIETCATTNNNGNSFTLNHDDNKNNKNSSNSNGSQADTPPASVQSLSASCSDEDDDNDEADEDENDESSCSDGEYQLVPLQEQKEEMQAFEKLEIRNSSFSSTAFFLVLPKETTAATSAATTTTTISKHTKHLGKNRLISMLQRGASLQEIKTLVKKYPHLLFKPDKDGFLPLHWACRLTRTAANFKMIPIVQYFLDHSPCAVRVVDSNRHYGFTPLHWACYTQQSFFLVQLLAKACPAAIVHPSIHQGGVTPLHMYATNAADSVPYLRLLLGCLKDHDHAAASISSSSSSISTSSSLSLQALSVTDHQGDTPLHIALRNVPSLESTQLMVNHDPTALRRIHPSSGQTPLHVAMRHVTLSKILCYLVSQDPAGMLLKDKAGQTPFHLYCHYNTAWADAAADILWTASETTTSSFASDCPVNSHVDMASLLVDARDSTGATPLHLAFQNIRYQYFHHVELIRLLLWHCQSAAQVADADGNLPLHLAAYSTPQHLSLLQALVERYPAAVEIPNRSAGQTPLHILLHRSKPSVSLAVLKLFLEHAGNACSVKDSYRLTPLLLACTLANATLDTVYLLVQANLSHDFDLARDVGQIVLVADDGATAVDKEEEEDVVVRADSGTRQEA